MGVRSGNRVMRRRLHKPFLVCRSHMKGSTTVLSITMLVDRSPNQLSWRLGIILKAITSNAK